jgi:hypothetical protein
MLVYTAISIELPPWLRNAMERIMKGFLWAGSEVVHGESPTTLALVWPWGGRHHS